MRREIPGYPLISDVPIVHASRNGRLERPSDHAECEEGEPKAFRPHIVARCAADIEPTEIHWLWENRIPRGRLTVLAGHGGLGKSFVSLAITSTLTTGADWPDGAVNDGPEAAIIMNCEDGPGDTIVPRLITMGADVGRVHIIDGVRRTRDGAMGFFSLADDVKALEELIVGTNAALCVVDPVGAYLNGVDSHRDADVRSVLGPLAAMAERTDCAVITVAHLNKSNSNKAAMRVNGSTAFTNAGRMAWLVASDPDDDSRRLFLPFKMNIVEHVDGLAFVLENNGLRWLADTVTTTADDALTESTCTRTEIDDAAEWLKQTLAGGPVPVTELRQAADAHDHAWRTIIRAKKSMGVESEKVGFGNRSKWCWRLASFEANPTKSATDGGDCPF